MIATYDMRRDDDGWTVFDTATGEAARVSGVAQTDLDIQDADELVDLLNRLARQANAASQH
mgnify:CR=1 FL=1